MQSVYSWGIYQNIREVSEEHAPPSVFLDVFSNPYTGAGLGTVLFL